MMQGFEPCGVFARDLRECLALQLKEQDRYDPAMASLIDNLDLLAVHDLAALKRVCRVSDEDLRDMIQEVKRLNPKPGLKYGSSRRSRSCRTFSCARFPMAASTSS